MAQTFVSLDDDAPSIIFGLQNRLVFCNSEEWYQLLIPYVLLERRCLENRRKSERDSENCITHKLLPIYYLQKYFLHMYFGKHMQRDEMIVYDGALFCVSCEQTSGITREQFFMLRDLLRMAVKPVLVIEHVHKLLANEYLDLEQIYQRVFKLVQEFEQICMQYGGMDFSVTCNKNYVVFVGDEWAFTIQQFVDMHNVKFQQPVTDKLWGDNYYDQQSKEWYTTPYASNDADTSEILGNDSIQEQGKQELKRSFCHFVLEPLRMFYAHGMTSVIQTKALLQQMVITVPEELATFNQGEKLVQYCLKLWLPIGTAVLSAAVAELPTIGIAQAYRCKYICKPNSPLIPFIQNPSENGPFIAFSTILHNTYRGGYEIIRIFSGSYSWMDKKQYIVNNANMNSLILCVTFHDLMQVTEAMFGCLLYARVPHFSAIVDANVQSDSLFATSSTQFVAVLRVTLSPNTTADLPKLVDACKEYAKKHNQVRYLVIDSGDHAFEAKTEAELEKACKYVSKFGTKVEVFAKYKETITGKASNMLTKTPNKNNRFFFEVSPVPEDLRASNKEYTMENISELQEMGFKLPIGAKIVHVVGNNVFSIMETDAAQFKEVVDPVKRAADWCCTEGPMIDSPIMGIHLHFTGMTLTSDAIHRGPGQIIPTIRRAIYGSVQSAEPRLMEGIYAITLEYLEEVQLRMLYSCL